MNHSSISQIKKPLHSNTSSSNSILQRKCICGNHTDSDSECGICKEKRHNLQKREIDDQSDRSTIPSMVSKVLKASGAPLESATQAFMESHFGRDFSHVRVHTDSEAVQSAREINALAYTVGGHIVFGAEQHKPDSPAGMGLIAHELTHVVQQKLGRVKTSNDVSAPGGVHEKEADRNADKAYRLATMPQLSDAELSAHTKRNATNLREDEDIPRSIEPEDPRFLYLPNGATTCIFPAGTATVTINNTDCTRPCTTRHEGVHRTDIAPCCTKAGRAHAAASTAAAKQTVEDQFFSWMSSNRSWFECRAYAESVLCADVLLGLKNCSSGPAAADAACCATLASYRADKETRRASNCAAAGTLSACPFT